MGGERREQDRARRELQASHERGGEAGPDAERARVQPIFDAVAQRTMWIGEAGAGSRLKLVTNAWIVAVVEDSGPTVVSDEFGSEGLTAVSAAVNFSMNES